MNVPYYCQWETPELAGPILLGQINAVGDPRWRNSGALTAEEYAFWSWNLCGMACLKMILAHCRHEIVPLITLAKQALPYGVYTRASDGSIEGLFYRPFVTFVQEKYSIKAHLNACLLVEDILVALLARRFVMASVSPQIRHPTASPPTRGGHLVLIVGYDPAGNVLYLHNPSGDSRESQKFVPIHITDFQRFFDNKGIIVDAME